MSRFSKMLIAIIVIAIIGFGGWWFFIRDSDDSYSSDFSSQATKYKNISFQVDSEWNDDAQLFLLYPITENEDINTSAAKEIDAVRDDFENDVRELKKNPANKDKVYDLHTSTDVNFASEDLVNFIYTIRRNNNFDGELIEASRFYDRKTGERLEIDAFFQEESDYLTRLSDLSRDILKTQLGDDYDQTLVVKGTAPEKEIYDDFGVASPDSMFFDFEPGTVAPYESGVIRVEIQLDDIDDILERHIEEEIFDAHAAELERAEQAEKQRQAEEAELGNVPAQSFGAVDCNSNKCVALTFDDGPGAYTEELLGILAQHNVKATFFMIGRQISGYASVVKDVASAGHEIGVHTWDHFDPTTLSDADVLSQVNRTKDAIAKATGFRPVLFRPPYGAVNDNVMSLLKAPIIQWSVDPEDWKDHDADIVFERVVNNTVNGSVVLSHDIHSTTVESYKRIVPKLLEEGFFLVTTSELLGLDPTNPVSQIYYSK